MNKKQILQATRLEAKRLGLTFKEQLNYVNGQTAYKVIDRKSQRLLASNILLSDGYNMAMQGYFNELKYQAHRQNYLD